METGPLAEIAHIHGSGRYIITTDGKQHDFEGKHEEKLEFIRVRQIRRPIIKKT